MTGVSSMRIILVSLFLMGMCAAVFAQGRPYDGPIDPAADIAAERSGFMTGNRVLLFFRNSTELGDCCGLGYAVSLWPNNFDGTKMHDGITVLLGARVFLENDTIPVTDPAEIASRTDLDTLYYMQASYREFMDANEERTVEWALYPVFGYFNELSETPAMSNKPESWPPAGWPSRGFETKWPGEWNGRFGRGVFKADLETYFVANDAQDQEYLQEGLRLQYKPRPNVRIGDLKPDVSVQAGQPWGGIGIRVEVRGFQWSNPAANDAIFFEYNISNTSDYDLPEMVFGFLLDNAVGGEEGVGDDIAFYNADLNMTFSWDFDFVPVGGGREPGILGFAFLESPGLPFDGIDNDEDGLLDEQRDNNAVNFVGPTDGIDDVNRFLEFYNLTSADLRAHWDADEDQDWQDGIDLNGNGTYAFFDGDEWRAEPGEEALDDVGLDGVGPLDLNYNGPDQDGTEGNHKPDFLEGIGAEPNFAITDINESDMLGLTTFRYLLSWGTCADFVPCSDQTCFEYITSGLFDEFQGDPRNFLELFASGIFPLPKGRTERISMSELHSYDPLAGLTSDRVAPSLFRLKEVVQLIYESDYRFAQPPLTPTLTAVPGDGVVTLTWDNLAETSTRDPFVGNSNDFEGYKLYRATDKKIADPEVITDGFGNPRLRSPIYQGDLIDNIFGFADYGEVDGVEFYLGNDGGIRNSFVDRTVQNGRTYYYVLVSYDYGIPAVGDGIPPSESSFTLEIDEADEIVDVSKNVAVVTPAAPAAGYIAPELELLENTAPPGVQAIDINVIAPELLQENHTYQVEFDSDLVTRLLTIGSQRHEFDQLYTTTGFQVYDVTDGERELVHSESPNRYFGQNFIAERVFIPARAREFEYWFLNPNTGVASGTFDGIQFNIENPLVLAQFDESNSGWVTGNGVMSFDVNDDAAVFFPWEHEFVFGESYTTRSDNLGEITNVNNRPIDQSKVLADQTFDFSVFNTQLINEEGQQELLDIVVYDADSNGVYEPALDTLLIGYTTAQRRGGSRWAATMFAVTFPNAGNRPAGNDVYRASFRRPFFETDSIQFRVKSVAALNTSSIKAAMDNIRVVPNPYIATNTMEEAVTNPQLSQRRKLAFTHLPAQCTIKIFTVSGVLVDVIEVNNSSDNLQNDWDENSSANGSAFWDLQTREGLDVSAGYYIYHVTALATGDTKVGKFAILK